MFEIEAGIYHVEFTNGEARDVEVSRNIIDWNGRPVYLESTDGRLYNWMNIISTRKKKA